MTMNETNNMASIARLRDMKVPDDYPHVAALFNTIEPDSVTAQSLEEEDRHVPATSHLTLNEHGLLAGFGRTRVVAENEEGAIIGYGASFRAPWTDPGQFGSTFCVHPDYRNQGVGSLLLAHIEKWANEQQASILLSTVHDWIDASLPFVEKRGFQLDAHVFDLLLDLRRTYDPVQQKDAAAQAMRSGIRFITFAEIRGEDSEQKLYELCVETAKDNPGQYGSLPPLEQWRNEFLPEDISRDDWIFIALDGDRFVGVTQLFTTDEEGVLYTNYTGVRKEYRGRGIAKALKQLSIECALKEGAHTLTTDAEESNAPMQAINRGFGFLPGKGHYRILKQLK
ncbi:GNAT family N-acetyltransferase [Sporosarcina cyprini]|uniref:GNAT family N-acetyltransferase n=1 Tax=Sporosarcina cyprini TaxID=2910523 RepID=UPI001EDCBF38|nr:GNAT family N-acetyltransferase [Sporosarcina cyprini]MCG3088388.1 GNAT family N-acetyltransferase [Sporosarcina cyprini]